MLRISSFGFQDLPDRIVEINFQSGPDEDLEARVLLKESSTYQAIVDKGRLQAMRSTLLRQGRVRFGPATESAQRAIQTIDNLEKLEQLTERLLTASSWQDLLRDL